MDGKEEKLSGWERREVKWMGKEFTDQIEGVKSLAMLTKERGKNDPTNDGCNGML